MDERRRRVTSIGQLWDVLADLAEPVIEALIRLCGWSAILFVLAIFVFVFREAVPVIIGGFDFRRVLHQPELATRLGDSPAIRHPGAAGGHGVGDGRSMVMAVPLGLGAAVYVSEFCTGRTKETLKVVIELLAAIPSVVWGFIGFMVLGPIIIATTGAPVGVNLLNGGIILALMSVPIIVSVGEDALKAVPDSYREAALALGASRWEIVYRVLFPAAKNGLLAAVLLGVGRAIGETMAVLMATGHAVQIPTACSIRCAP